MKVKISRRDKQLIEQLLTYNTNIAKTTVQIYNEIHNHPSPDFGKINDLIIKIKSWIKQIEILREVVRERKFDPKKLVSAYLYDTESLPGWLVERERHIADVRKKVYQKRQAWVYTNEKTLTYEPEYWLENSTIKLAGYFNISLD